MNSGIFCLIFFCEITVEEGSSIGQVTSGGVYFMYAIVDLSRNFYLPNQIGDV
jgi:hypothetical protein